MLTFSHSIGPKQQGSHCVLVDSSFPLDFTIGVALRRHFCFHWILLEPSHWWHTQPIKLRQKDSHILCLCVRETACITSGRNTSGKLFGYVFMLFKLHSTLMSALPPPFLFERVLFEDPPDWKTRLWQFLLEITKLLLINVLLSLFSPRLCPRRSLGGVRGYRGHCVDQSLSRSTRTVVRTTFCRSACNERCRLMCSLFLCCFLCLTSAMSTIHCDRLTWIKRGWILPLLHH